MMNEEFDMEPMSEAERNRTLKRFNADVKKGLCSFCGIWHKKYGHEDWCKKK